MPCYDKKLEAVRPELESEVDAVLATHEILDLFNSLNIDLSLFKETPLPL